MLKSFRLEATVEVNGIDNGITVWKHKTIDGDFLDLETWVNEFLDQVYKARARSVVDSPDSTEE